MLRQHPLSAWSSTSIGDILKPDQNSFGVIRIAMALSVLVSHSFYFVTGNSAAEPLVEWTGHSLGEHAVQVFFFLSGILVTQSVLRSNSALDFATGRALRIFPGLIVCVVLTALVLGPMVTQLSIRAYFSEPLVSAYIVKTVLLTTGAAALPGVFDHLPAAGLVNMSLWTLKYEVLCYAGLAVIGLPLLRQPSSRAIATFALAPVIMTIFLRSPSVTEAYSAAENVRYFALYFGVGALAALNKDRVVIDWRAAIGFGIAYWYLRGTPLTELSCAMFIGAFTLLAATCTFGPLRALANRNDLSFGIYIYAAPVQQALLQAFPNLDPIGLTVLSLSPVTLLATASWVCIEKPALGMRGAVVQRAGRLFGQLNQRVTRAPDQETSPPFQRERLALALRRHGNLPRTAPAGNH